MMNGQITRRQRLRRVVLLSASFVRNLVFYRVGQEGRFRSLFQPHHDCASFWLQANGNFLDILVLEWCKLFADTRGEHCWKEVVSDSDAFEAGLFAHLEITREEFTGTVTSFRRYRDKFIAHLDTDLTMHIPVLATAEAAVRYYHEHVVNREARPGDLVGLTDTVEKMVLGYEQCRSEAEGVLGRAVA
jgi:hypothetical protein